MKTTCPKCDITTTCSDRLRGSLVACPKCQMPFVAMPSMSKWIYYVLFLPLPVNKELFGISTDTASESYIFSRRLRFIFACLFVLSVLGTLVGSYAGWTVEKRLAYSFGGTVFTRNAEKLADDEMLLKIVMGLHDKNCVSPTSYSAQRKCDFKKNDAQSAMIYCTRQFTGVAGWVTMFSQARISAIESSVQNGLGRYLSDTINDNVEKTKLAEELTGLLSNELKIAHASALAQVHEKLPGIALKYIGLCLLGTFISFVVWIWIWAVTRFMLNFLAEHIIQLRNISSNTAASKS